MKTTSWKICGETQGSNEVKEFPLLRQRREESHK